MSRVFDHSTSSAVCLDVEVNPTLPRTESKAVPEGKDSFPYDDYGSGELTMEEICRIFAEELDNRIFRQNGQPLESMFRRYG